MLLTISLFLLSLTLGAGQAAAQVPAGDPVSGKKAFGACVSCHSVTSGQTGIGPHLAGIVGKKAGTNDAKFKYSPAMTAAPVWTEAQLDRFLADPRQSIPGNTMTLAPVKDPKRRADIIAYLK